MMFACPWRFTCTYLGFFIQITASSPGEGENWLKWSKYQIVDMIKEKKKEKTHICLFGKPMSCIYMFFSVNSLSVTFLYCFPVLFLSSFNFWSAFNALYKFCVCLFNHKSCKLYQLCNAAICMCMCVGKGAVCQISVVVIKIATKYPSQTFKPMEDVIGCLLVTCWSAVSRCAVPRASTEWSLSANSFNSGSTRTILHSLTIKGGPFSSYFRGLFFTMGDKKSPTR